MLPLATRAVYVYKRRSGIEVPCSNLGHTRAVNDGLIVVTGGGGMLGSSFPFRSPDGRVVRPLDRSDLDLARDPDLAERLLMYAPKIAAVINAAAYTDVDGAEENLMAAYAGNVHAAARLAEACADLGVPLWHISTDFVFDGQKQTPYEPDDDQQALGVYGKTKKLGEWEVLSRSPSNHVVRTAWLYGPKGHCFPRSILRAIRAGRPLRVVVDQVGSPTYTPDLANALLALVESGAETPEFHAAGPAAMSWHEFAVEIAATYANETGTEPVAVEAINTADWPTKAERPKYSVLDSSVLPDTARRHLRSPRECLPEFVREFIRQEG